MKVRQVYELPNVHKGYLGYNPQFDYVYPILRCAIWDRDHDLKNKPRTYPRRATVESKLYQVSDNQLRKLHRLVLALNKALRTFPFESRGVSKKTGTARRPEAGVPNQTALGYLLKIRRGGRFTMVELSSSSLVATDYTAAFVKLWDFLDGLCTPKHPVSDDWREHWAVPPKRYAAAMDVAYPRETKGATEQRARLKPVPRGKAERR